MANEQTGKALAIIPQTVDEAASLAARFAKASLLPPDLRGKEADVFVTIMAGSELGLPPMAALRGIHVVKGKPILSADTMVGVVLGRGVAKYFSCVDESDTSVTYETHREGAPKPQRMTWTAADAKRAGLDGDNWRKYPRAMLKARCKAALARDVYPDVLAGCYEHDEANEIAAAPVAKMAKATVTDESAKAETIIDAEFVDAPIAADAVEPLPDDFDNEVSITIIAIRECDNAAELKSIAAGIKKMGPKVQDAVRSAYYARREELAK